MFKEFLYRGRHRVTSNTVKTLAVITAAMTLPTVAATSNEAHAAEGPDWGPIVACESGGKNIENGGDPGGVSTASGYFQFVNGTWRAYGGTQFASRAIQATYAEQLTVANRAFAREGYRPWYASRSCWQGKLGKGVSVSVKEAPKKQETSKKTDSKLNRQKSVAPAVVKAPKPAKRAVPESSVVTPGTEGGYIVKPGDTLTGIAKANNVPGGWKTLANNNQAVVEHPDWIFPGERIDLN